MDPRLIIRAIAVALLAGSAFACAVEVGRLGGDRDPSATSTSENADPLATEIARCKALGDAAVDDAACKEAWAKSRDRFFGNQTPRQDSRINLFPSTSDAPSAKTEPKIFLDRAPAPSQPNSGKALNPDSEGR